MASLTYIFPLLADQFGFSAVDLAAGKSGRTLWARSLSCYVLKSSGFQFCEIAQELGMGSNEVERAHDHWAMRVRRYIDAWRIAKRLIDIVDGAIRQGMAMPKVIDLTDDPRVIAHRILESTAHHPIVTVEELRAMARAVLDQSPEPDLSADLLPEFERNAEATT